MRTSIVVAALALGALACGDPDSSDERGYTKAPLENPGLLVRGEEPTRMAALGKPDLLLSEDPAGAELEGAEDGAAAGPGEQQPASLAPGVTQEQFEEGRQLFAGAGGCQACHGPNGGGSQIAPDLTDDEWLHVSAPETGELGEVIRTGVPQPAEFPAPMPPMGGASLNDQQVQALAAYVASIAQG